MIVHPPDRPFARVDLRRGDYVLVPFDVLEHDEGGGYRLLGRWQDYTVRRGDGSLTIPVVQERVTTSVRAAPERKLKVRRRLVTEAKVVERPYWHERFDVERVPIGRLVDRAPAPRREGDVLIVPCVEEVVVVEKRLRLREEMRIRVVRERRMHRETIRVHRHELDIDAADEPVVGTKKGDIR